MTRKTEAIESVPGRQTTGAAAASKERLRLWLRMLKASKHIEAELRERLRVEFDTTLPRFDVMAALYRAEAGLKMSELSGVLRVSNGNVTGIVDRLVNDGLIVRVPVDNDRRATTVRLTKAGREDFARMAAAHEAWIDALLGDVDPADIPAINAVLERAAKKSSESEE
ncbi:MAG: MarR family transcriptional regulator [Brucellaceae bacterium]|nr:MarR family transcriptional regulator [Brucellaceae bacterium]